MRGKLQTIYQMLVEDGQRGGKSECRALALALNDMPKGKRHPAAPYAKCAGCGRVRPLAEMRMMPLGSYICMNCAEGDVA